MAVARGATLTFLEVSGSLSDGPPQRRVTHSPARICPLRRLFAQRHLENKGFVIKTAIFLNMLRRASGVRPPRQKKEVSYSGFQEPARPPGAPCVVDLQLEVHKSPTEAQCSYKAAQDDP